MTALSDYSPHPGSTLYLDRKQTFPCNFYRTETVCKGGALCPMVHVSDTDTLLCSDAALAHSEKRQQEADNDSDPNLVGD